MPRTTKTYRRGALAAMLAAALAFALPATAFASAADYGYPYPNAPDCDELSAANCVGDMWGFVQGQCMSWVAFRLNQLNAAQLTGTFTTTYRQPPEQDWDNGIGWREAATRAGMTVDDNPALGSVAWWSTDGGHVAYVEHVDASGTVQVSEMNFDYHNGFRFATLQRGVRWPDAFLHIADRPPVDNAAVPGAPANVHATAGNARAQVTWSAPADDGGSTIVGYTVTSAPGGRVATVGGTARTATVTGLTNGTTYRFTVHAINAVGTSAESSSNAVVPAGPPDAPTAVQATRGDRAATVTWSAPGRDNGSAINGYTITADPGAMQVTAEASSTNATLTGLANGTAYTFTVRATNGIGGATSTPSNVVVPAGVPEAPTNVRAVAGTDGVSVSWRASSGNGAAVTAYDVRVYRQRKLVERITVGATTRTVVRGLVAGATYAFRVTARNAVGASAASATSPGVKVPITAGYWMLASDGTVYAFGGVRNVGNGGNASVQIVPTGPNGYYVVTASTVYAFGDAPVATRALPKLLPFERVTSLSVSPGRRAGYWLFTSRGRVIPVTAKTASAPVPFYGDLSKLQLARPIVGSVATPTGRGYYMVAADGGVFAFGDAHFYGSTGNLRLQQPVVALVPSADNRGYWLVAADGGVFAFGSARFKGSMGGVRLTRPVVGMVRYGNGYLMVASDGGVFNFSNRAFVGSLGGRPSSSPVVSIATPG